MKTRIQVSLNPLLVAEAKRLMKLRGYDSLSEFVEHLIRDEWDRRPAKTELIATANRLNEPGARYEAHKHK